MQLQVVTQIKFRVKKKKISEKYKAQCKYLPPCMTLGEEQQRVLQVQEVRKISLHREFQLFDVDIQTIKNIHKKEYQPDRMSKSALPFAYGCCKEILHHYKVYLENSNLNKNIFTPYILRTSKFWKELPVYSYFQLTFTPETETLWSS